MDEDEVGKGKEYWCGRAGDYRAYEQELLKGEEAMNIWNFGV